MKVAAWEGGQAGGQQTGPNTHFSELGRRSPVEGSSRSLSWWASHAGWLLKDPQHQPRELQKKGRDQAA